MSGQELDDVWADCLAAVGEAMTTWQADGGRSFASWAWLVMDHRVPRERQRRHRWRGELTPDGEWLEPDATEHGYARVDDADELQRIADWCAFTSRERFALKWWSVHAGTIVRHVGGPERWFPEIRRSDHAVLGNARRKLRAAAGARDEWWQSREVARCPT